MFDPALDATYDLACIALEPVPIEAFSRHTELDGEAARQVLRLDLAALLPPKPQQGCFVIAHDDAGIGAADEAATAPNVICVSIASQSSLREDSWEADGSINSI